MNNKLLITIYVPLLERKYDLFIPANKQTNESIILIEKALEELSSNVYKKNNSRMYKRENFEELDYTKTIKENGIKNGSELVII